MRCDASSVVVGHSSGAASRIARWGGAKRAPPSPRSRRDGYGKTRPPPEDARAVSARPDAFDRRQAREKSRHAAVDVSEIGARDVDARARCARAGGDALACPSMYCTERRGHVDRRAAEEIVTPSFAWRRVSACVAYAVN